MLFILVDAILNIRNSYAEDESMSIDVLTVSSKGQIVLPAEMRKRLSIRVIDMCRRFIFVFTSMIVLMLAGCSSKGQVIDGSGMTNSYNQISQEEAKKMMEQDDGHIIVDVRRQDEYDSGHIPGAILIPNESIGDTISIAED